MLRAMGDTVLWADLFLSLKTNRGVWKQVPFRVDSGTEMTTMPAYVTKSLDLPILTKPASNLALYGRLLPGGAFEPTPGALRHRRLRVARAGRSWGRK
jgi:hypothetical protein